MQLGRRGLPALSPRIDRSCRLPHQAGLRAGGGRHRRTVSGPQLICVPVNSLGGMSQILRIDLDRFGHGEPFCQLAIDATSGAVGSCTQLCASQLTSAKAATQFVNCQ